MGKLARTARRFIARARFKEKYGFSPPPDGTDSVGFEVLIDFIQEKNIFDVPGHVIQVGAFLGGGTYKLAKTLAQKTKVKTLYVIDWFNVGLGPAEFPKDVHIVYLYDHSNDRTQKEAFQHVTRGLNNIVVLDGDSTIAGPLPNQICFAFIDGYHSVDYVRHDFNLVWGRLNPGGAVAFSTYGYDLPEVTSALDELCGQHRQDISNQFVHEGKHILFVQKRLS